MNPNEKFERMFHEVNSGFTEENETIKNRGESFQKAYKATLEKLDNYFRSNCSEDINWLEMNTQSTERGPVLKDRSKSEELKTHMEGLEKCIGKHDIGSQDLLTQFDAKMHALTGKMNSGYKTCITLKSETEVRNCFKASIKENVNDQIKFFDEFSVGFQNLDKKL